MSISDTSDTIHKNNAEQSLKNLLRIVFMCIVSVFP